MNRIKRFNPPFLSKYLYQVRVITVFTVFRLLTDFVCLYAYEFWLSLCKIVRSSLILLLPLFGRKHHISEKMIDVVINQISITISRRPMICKTVQIQNQCHALYFFYWKLNGKYLSINLLQLIFYYLWVFL